MGGAPPTGKGDCYKGKSKSVTKGKCKCVKGIKSVENGYAGPGDGGEGADVYEGFGAGDIDEVDVPCMHHDLAAR